MKWKITKKRPWTGAVLHKGQKAARHSGLQLHETKKKNKKMYIKDRKAKTSSSLSV